MPTVVQSCRVEKDHAALLSKQAKRRHLEVSTLSSLYLKEKALEEEYPGSVSGTPRVDVKLMCSVIGWRSGKSWTCIGKQRPLAARLIILAGRITW